MKKNMYSLMLSEEVISEIDRLAEREGTTRSHLVNEILADYVSVVTPEKRITDVFRQIESLFENNENFPVYYANHDNTLSIKSALSYRYRPTLRYEVELYRVAGDHYGELKVNFRTQSPELLTRLTEFFRLWQKMEEIYVTALFNRRIEYSLDECTWTRSLSFKKSGNYNTDDLGKELSNYVKVFDKMLKKYLSDGYKTLNELENDYLAALNAGNLTI